MVESFVTPPRDSQHELYGPLVRTRLAERRLLESNCAHQSHCVCDYWLIPEL